MLASHSSTASIEFDTAIIGGGIVGLATAYQYQIKFPGRRVVVLEKEPEVAAHQTGHNSGVLHSGIYYKPGSLKALNCREGKRAMEEFCQTHGIPYDVCGKVIVAVDEQELPALQRIFERGQQNGVKCEMIGRERLSELEPHAAGIQAIHVPEAGIVNYRTVGQKLAQLVRTAGGEVHTGVRVNRLTRESSSWRIESPETVVQAKFVVNCTGLHADRTAKLSGVRPDALIVPFRGEFYELKPEVHHLCRNLIYPVPNPNFPFLGVHFTRMIDGGIECGPNAVFAFAREGYTKGTVNLRDLFEALTYRGFLKLSAKYWRIGLDEMWRSFSKRAFVKALQRLMPAIRCEHLVAGRAGVRAQAIAPDGTMVDDFWILPGDRVINVCNAPSPAATSSLNIGRLIVDKME